MLRYDPVFVFFPFLQEHVFFRSLSRDAKINLGPLNEKIGRLTDGQIVAYAEAVPPEWRQGNDLCDKITAYLLEARAERETLIQFIQHLLR